jgi:hypothetical protein
VLSGDILVYLPKKKYLSIIKELRIFNLVTLKFTNQVLFRQ